VSDIIVVTLMATCFFLPFGASAIAYLLSNEEEFQVTIGMRIAYIATQTICAIAMVPVGLLASKNLGWDYAIWYWFFGVLFIPIAYAIGGHDEEQERQKKRKQEDEENDRRYHEKLRGV
jgi:hypothetical protein